MDTESNIAWIIGASSGLGRALALRCAEAGWHVIASARSADKLDDLAEEAMRLPGVIQPMPLDMTSIDSVCAAVARLHDTAITHCFLNAARYEPATHREFDAESYRQHMTVNYLGLINALDAILSRPNPPANLYITASVAGYRGLPRAGGYGASKAALINLAEGLRFDLAASGVCVRLICPGFIATPLTDKNDFRMPFLISAEAAADRIYRQLGGNGFEISFPRRFTWLLKLARLLPYRIYFPMIARATGT